MPDMEPAVQVIIILAVLLMMFIGTVRKVLRPKRVAVAEATDEATQRHLR